MFEAWLRCVIYKGMFSDEWAVKYQPRNGAERSFFVPRSEVSGIDANGKLRVRIFKKDHTSWAILPTENKTIIPVDEEDVMNA